MSSLDNRKPTPVDGRNAWQEEPVVSKATSVHDTLTTEKGDTLSINSSNPQTPDVYNTQSEKDEGIVPGDLERGTPSSTTHNPDEVFWEKPEDQDQQNPMNWSGKKKWANILTVSAVTFVFSLGSSMFAPGVPQVMREFRSTNSELASFIVSIYILGFAMGPLVLAPISEIYGRLPVYHSANVLFLVFTVCCAKSSSMGMLIAFRLLAGCVASAPVTIGAGTIADLMPVEKRGGALALFALGPLLGPVVGPIIGGFLVDAKGWPWVFWLISILDGALIILSVIFLRETWAPLILERKAEKLRKSSGNLALASKLSNGLTKQELFARSIIRPIKLLCFSPIVLLLPLYCAVAYGVLYLMFTTFTFVFEDQYHFSTSIIGLSYIGIGLGMIFATVVIGVASDRIIRAISASGQRLRPEDRLNYWLTIPGAICLPIGLFIYGWTSYYKVHWIVPILGTVLIGAGILACMMCVQNYLVDSFTVYAASAIAANTVLRSIFGAVLPVAGLSMNSTLGLGWSNSLLAFVSLALIPLPAFFRIKGESIRTNPKFAINL